MNINKLLNPVPNKKPRFIEETLAYDEYWLPTELIAYIMTLFHFHFRPKFRFVSKKWYTAYDLYLRNEEFSDEDHVFNKRVTREQVLNAFVNYGRQLHWLRVHTSTLREILDVEPNFTDLIPNVTFIRITVNDGLLSQRLIGDFVMKLGKLKKLIVQEYGFTADEHLAYEMDKAVAAMPRLREVYFRNTDMDFNVFPGPSMKEVADQIRQLVVSVGSIEPGMVVSRFTIFKNVRRLGLRGISSVGVLKEVTEMVTDEKNFPAMYRLDVYSEFDLSHASPIVNEENGSRVTAMDLYLKIFSIRRPRYVLRVGFILGACSKNNSELIEREREFVVNMGKTGADVIAELELTHYTPVGDYDPLTTLFYESAARYPKLLFLYPHVSPTAVTGPRLIKALNNPFLLPHLIQAIFFVDGMQSPEWVKGYNPVDPSRGILFSINEMQHEDETRMINENNNGITPSRFLC
ncbi:hypothetical protein GQ42DRAFT_11703 [Ramicandelaber brevisporus]|nr:hypothetical protein GQ42DRAFT_28874 [Ramicandelaber brevisporus]KAI8870750.1 hypothetical protein GQ42DRAFT_11703 [Ramicandelaber brevisporus]